MLIELLKGAIRRPADITARLGITPFATLPYPVSYTHLRAHETVLDLVCRLLLEKNNVHIPRAEVKPSYSYTDM